MLLRAKTANGELATSISWRASVQEMVSLLGGLLRPSLKAIIWL
jgi:hypothetical protein